MHLGKHWPGKWPGDYCCCVQAKLVEEAKSSLAQGREMGLGTSAAGAQATVFSSFTGKAAVM